MSYRNLKSRARLLFVLSLWLAVTPAARADAWQSNMYNHISQDTEIFKKELEPFLTQMYSNLLDQHNLKRLYDYHRVFYDLERRRALIEPMYNRAVDALEGLQVQRRSPILLPGEQSRLLSEEQFYVENLKTARDSMSELAVTSARLEKSWNNRGSDTVVDNLAKLFDFKNTFHEPHIAPNANYDSYMVYFSASYVPESNTMSYAEAGLETKQDPVMVAFTVTQGVAVSVLLTSPEPFSKALAAVVLVVVLVAGLLYSGHKIKHHEDKVTGLINEQYAVINSIRDKLEAKQKEAIQASIQKILVEGNDPKIALGARLHNLSEELAAFRDRLSDRLAYYTQKSSESFVRFERDVEKLADADTNAILTDVQTARRHDLARMRDFNRDARDFARGTGQEILRGLLPVGGSPFAARLSQRTALVQVLRQDALFGTKYLNGALYREDKDFFFNDRQFLLRSYPAGDWLGYLMQFMEQVQ